jgi:tetratricopeptide (TPR) repeat protein
MLEYSSWLIDYDKDAAIKMGDQARALASRQNYSYGEGRSYNLQGIAHAERGEYEKALEAYQKALSPLGTANALLELGKVHNNIGNLYNFQGQLQEATEHYFKAIQYLEKVKHPIVFGIYNNLATGLTKLNQFDKAIQYSQLGLQGIRGSSDTITLVNLLTTISAAYFESGNIAKSLPYLRETMLISKQKGYMAGIGVASLNLADYHSHFKLYDSSLFYLQQALSFTQKAGDPIYIEEAHYALAKVYFTLKQYEKAYQHLIKSERVGKQLNDREHLAKTYNLLSDYYVAKGQYAKGLEAFRRSKVYEDSLRNEASVRNIQMLEARYQSAEKDKQLARQQLAMAETDDRLAKKNMMITAGIAGILVAAFVLFLLQRQYRQNQRLQKLQIQTLRQENEMKALKSQIEPHFLFNTLNSISASVPHTLEHTREMIAQLADTFRYGLATNDRREVRLEEELNFIKTWLSLEQARLGKRLDVVYQIDEACLSHNIPPMLLQPLIENALEHGIGPKVQGGVVTIQCRKEGAYVRIAVADTGIGYNGDVNELFEKGIGVSNTARRLRLLFNETLEIEKGEEGLRFSFRIPVNASGITQLS